MNKIKDTTLRGVMTDFINGKGGIEPSVGVIFGVGYYTYFTGIAADPSAFKAAVEKATGAKFSSQEDMEICGNTAVKGNRFWVNLGTSTIDAREAKHFATLSEDQSFVTNTAADNLCKIEKDIEGWGSISGLLNTANLGFQEKATAQVALQTLFEDPSSFGFTVDFKKGEMQAEGYLMNSKGKKAKYLFPTETVDVKTIESVGGTSSGLIAISIPGKLIKKLQEEVKSKQPSALGMILPALSPIDGTTAVAFSDAANMRGVIMTTGENTGVLTTLLEQFGVSAKINGKALEITKGQVTGTHSVAEMSKFFKGSIAGFATAVPQNAPGAAKNSFESGAFMLVADGGGITFRVTLFGIDKDRNFLIPLLTQAN